MFCFGTDFKWKKKNVFLFETGNKIIAKGMNFEYVWWFMWQNMLFKTFPLLSKYKKKKKTKTQSEPDFYE